MNTLVYHHPSRTGQRERGYSLLEILVALLVLSIGLLGLAALQTTGLRFNHQSYARTQAALQISDVIERMRVNRSGAAANTAYDDVTLGEQPTAEDCVSDPCTPAELAEFDIRNWNLTNAALLPEGRGAICRGTFNSTFTTCTVNTSGTVYHVVVKWKENDLEATFEAQTQL